MYWTRRLGVLAGATVSAVTVAVVGVAVPAHAAAATHVVSVTERFDSDPKGDGVGCGSGFMNVGGGAYLSGAVGHAHIASLRKLTGVYVATAHEEADGYDAPWSLTVQSLCAPTIARTIDETVGHGPDDPTSSTAAATCPINMSVIGAAAEDRHMHGMPVMARPSADLRSVTGAVVPDATAAPAPVRALVFASCATHPLGLQRVAAIGTLSSASPQTVVARCPFDRHLYGTGYAIMGRNIFGALVPMSGVVLDDLRVTNNSVTVTAYESGGGPAGNWRVEAYAICV